jgi:hypothetical protein
VVVEANIVVELDPLAVQVAVQVVEMVDQLLIPLVEQQLLDKVLLAEMYQAHLEAAQAAAVVAQ